MPSIGRKGGEKMKTIPLLLGGLLFASSLGSYAEGASAQDMVPTAPAVIVVDRVGNYCHMKFPAIREDSLGNDHPILKSRENGDLVDFYDRVITIRSEKMKFKRR
jgi:hypothetical protein